MLPLECEIQHSKLDLIIYNLPLGSLVLYKRSMQKKGVQAANTVAYLIGL